MNIMKLIAHRGLVNGPDKSIENHPEQIDLAVSLGHDAEVDLRVENEQLFLGHDEPQYSVSADWLFQRKSSLWIHCKDVAALEYCLKNQLHFFWHNIDDYTLTSLGFVWAYPGKQNVGKNCILVMPELHHSLAEIKRLECFGVCSDFVDALKQ